MRNRVSFSHHLGYRITFVVSLILIVVVAGALRTFNLNWDRGTHLHPDERFLTMVVSAVRFPGEASDGVGAPQCTNVLDCAGLYFDTDRSPLNPANREFSYVYGTLPLFSTRAVGLIIDEACEPEPSRGAVLLRWLLLGTRAPCTPGTYLGYGGIHLVGRALSALADLATLIGLALMTRALYDRRTALLAGLLYAFAVLPIQHAHFFVVDSFATVFVVWTLYFCVLSLRRHSLGWLVLAGLTTGLAVASKISVFPLAGIVAVAGFYRPDVVPSPETPGSFGRFRFRISMSVMTALIAAGVLAAAGFRSAQPYAFTGPGFLGVSIHPAWLNTMQNIREIVTGLRDVPFGHQWTERTPLIFPWRNMVFWGLGLPLGLMAWIGWGVIGWRAIVKRRRRHLLLWIWGTLFFVYQGTQWVKSMRYLLPIYPIFVLFAAWFAARSVRWGRLNLRRSGWLYRVLAGLGIGLPAVVVLGAAFWALAFLSIYAQPVTRIAASEWIYDNVPTAVVIEAEDGRTINLPLQPSVTLNAGGAPVRTQLRLDSDVDVAALILSKVSPLRVGGARAFEAVLENVAASATEDLAENDLSVEVRNGVATATEDFEENRDETVRLAFEAPVAMQEGDTLTLALLLEQGAPVRLNSSVLANEHWDDALPLRIDGRDPFWNWYQGLASAPNGQMANYDEDTPEKRRNLLNWLDEADYIMLSSNRLYASIPRLPMRYPLTTEYYRVLFSGALGFDLAASFVSYPSLGPCQFPDQEIPFPLAAPDFTNARPCEVGFPPAEEAFSVYDHPTVLIFAKSARYSRARAEALLPLSLLDDVRWMTPREATRGTNTPVPEVLMPPRYRMEQESGGTWSRLFHTSDLHNRYQRLAAALWALMITVLGWIAFPLLYLALPQLRYRGYGLARIFGLLLWAYLAWILASIRLLPYTRAVLWLLVALMTALAVWIVYRRRHEFAAFLSENWRPLLTVETIFFGLFVLWLGVRWMNPDLWHPIMGGEKPMDFAYLNAVIKSTWFPPYDPWFAGGTMNYYYFGFVIVANPIKVLGIVPAVAYNLAIPSLYALIGVGAYTLASNLAGGDAQRGHRAGVWGVLFVLVLGNLGEAHLLFNGLVTVGGVDFESLIPGYPRVVSALVGLWKVIFQGAPLQFRPEWWYWNARSLIPAPPGENAPINEFPAFTLLYADLHAHVIALPITQLALSIGLQWGLAARRTVLQGWDRVRTWRRAMLPGPPFSLILAGLVVGSLRATNTWDYPTYLALTSASYLLGVVVGSLKLPSADKARTGGVVAVPESRPDLIAGLVEAEADQDVTPPLLPVSTATRRVETPRSHILRRLLLSAATPVLLLAWAELLFRPFVANYASAYTSLRRWEGSRTPLDIYLLMHGHLLLPIAAAALIGIWRMLRQRRHAWNVNDSLRLIAVLLIVAVLVTLFVGFLEVQVAWLLLPLGVAVMALLVAPQTPTRRRLIWFWTGTALAIGLFVELFVLRGDISRMNTVFKFYFQAWLLFALAAAVFTERLFHADLGLVSLLNSRGAVSGAVAIERTSDDFSSAPQAASVGAMVTEEAAPLADQVAIRPLRIPLWIFKLNNVVALATALLIVAAGLYPAFAIPAKMQDRWVPDAPHTLNGMQFMRHAVQIERGVRIQLEADYRVIRWLQEHVEGSPTIIEALAEHEYLWGNRISIYTGLPAVVGWRWHQVQQRSTMPPGTVESRQADVHQFYDTTVPERALDILKTYDVKYVILAPYERAYMAPEGLRKFQTMVDRAWLEIVYQDEASTIYRVVG